MIRSDCVEMCNAPSQQITSYAYVLYVCIYAQPRDMNSSCKREQIPAAWLRVMRERFCKRLTLHGVGVGPEDFELLEELCAAAGVRVEV